MQISDEGLKEFITICSEDYGVQLSEGDARVYAVGALMLYELIAQPFPTEVQFNQPSEAPTAPHHERGAP